MRIGLTIVMGRYISAVVLCVGYLCVFVVGCSVEGVLADVFL